MNKGDRVKFKIGNEAQEGIIKRKQGKFGYMVSYRAEETSQDFMTQKITTYPVIRTNYFKASDLKPV